jgi:hypothetical protein
MAGLAATISCPPSTAAALAAALLPRGPDVATSRSGDAALVVRAAMPVVHDVDGCRIAVDGIAELSTLTAAYRAKGPVGLLGGTDAYAVIVKDPARDGLLLGRNGDGPPLYYARIREGTVVASEPEALLAAGVPATPNTAVIDAFLATGACDDSAETFFADIRRILPNQVVTVRATAVDETLGRVAPRPVSPRLSLRWAASGSIGVRLGSGPVSAAILGAALGSPNAAVYSNRFPGLTDSADQVSAVLKDLPVSHRALPFFPDALDIDAFLDDVGEPLPDLDSYLLWATATAIAGEVDALLDAAEPAPHLARLADRVAGRYGVELRFPLALTLSGPADIFVAEEWAAVARQTLPVMSALAALEDVPVRPPMAAFLARMGPDLAAALLHDQPPGDAGDPIPALADLAAGRRADADLLFRRYVLAHWLHRYAQRRKPSPRPPAKAIIGGTIWRRIPVGTELLHPGDPLAEKIAWYVAETVAAQAEPQPWYVLVAAKAVAVAQGRVRPVWEIRPSVSARLAARLSGRPAWLEQVAVVYGGSARTLAVAVLERLRLKGIAERITTSAMAGIRPPRPDGAGPARFSVVVAPRDADEAAQEIFATLAKVLNDAELEALRGCAIVSAGPQGVHLHGFAGPGDREIAVALAQGDPFGSGGVREPLVVALAMAPDRVGPGRKVTRRPVR